MKIIHDKENKRAGDIMIEVMSAMDGDMPLQIEAGKDKWIIDNVEDARRFGQGMLATLIMVQELEQ